LSIGLNPNSCRLEAQRLILSGGGGGGVAARALENENAGLRRAVTAMTADMQALRHEMAR